MNTAPINHRDPIEYLINAMERAGQEDKPAEHSYGEKRLAVLAAIAALRAERDTANAQVTRLTSELAFVRNEAEGFNAAWAFALERADAERDVAVARTEQAERERDALMVRVDQWRQMADREATAHVEMRAERDAALAERDALFNSAWAVLNDEPQANGEYVHAVTCSADRKKPIGCGGCSCQLGRRIKLLAAALTEARRVLRKIEWVRIGGKMQPYCPCCWEQAKDGHAANCALAVT